MRCILTSRWKWSDLALVCIALLGTGLLLIQLPHGEGFTLFGARNALRGFVPSTDLSSQLPEWSLSGPVILIVFYENELEKQLEITADLIRQRDRAHSDVRIAIAGLSSPDATHARLRELRLHPDLVLIARSPLRMPAETAVVLLSPAKKIVRTWRRSETTAVGFAHDVIAESQRSAP
jgi:hypothetical protein